MDNNAPKPTSQVISEFMKMTDCRRVCLYGGAAIDRYLDPNVKIMDYDIAIKDINSYKHALEKLQSAGFDVGTPRFSFNLATVAKHKEHGVFDLSCMDIRQNGIFNYEKFYIEYTPEYPQGRAIDSYGTVHAMREGRIEIVNNPDKEHAYDLLRRFSVLAGKYGFSLERGEQKINEPTMATIERRLEETPIDKNNEHSRVRCLSRLFGAVFRAQNQADFLENMGKTGLLKYGYPALNTILNDKDFIADIRDNPAENKQDLINKMLNHTENNIELRDNYLDEISLLLKRERDREDPQVIQRVDKLGDEKTSINRLNKQIISPLLAFARRKENQ